MKREREREGGGGSGEKEREEERDDPRGLSIVSRDAAFSFFARARKQTTFPPIV